MSILNLPTEKLKRIIALKSQIDRLQSQLEKLAGSSALVSASAASSKKSKMSAAARRKISLAQKARWAKVKAASKSK